MLFLQSFKAGVNNSWRNSFDNYQIPLIEIKGFNVSFYFFRASHKKETRIVGEKCRKVTKK